MRLCLGGDRAGNDEHRSRKEYEDMGSTRIHSTSATWDNHSPMGPIQEHWHFLICYKADLNSQLAPIEDAQAPICGDFTAYSEERGPPAPQPLEFSTSLFMVGQSTGFTMGLYGGMAETTISSWKADQGGTLHLATPKKTHYFTPIEGLYGRFSNFFGRAGDSGAAVIDRFGLFVGLYFAGNDYTGVGYFVAADKLFADIKHIAKASHLQVL